MALTAILVAVGYSLVFYLNLDEPVFFHHYYDQRVFSDMEYYQDISFKLGYITNSHDDRVVIAIEFPEYPEVAVHASEYGHRDPFNWGFEQDRKPGNDYGQYNVRSVACTIVDLPEDLEGIVITKARIVLSDSSEMTVDIGKIHLYEHMPEETPFQHVSSSGSSDGTSKTRYRTLKDLTITGIDSSFMDKFEDRVQWQVNNKNPDSLVGMEFQKGAFLEATSKVGFADNIVSEYTRFDINPKLIFTDDDGIQYSQRFYNINSLYHNYTFMDLYRYIRAREGN